MKNFHQKKKNKNKIGTQNKIFFFNKPQLKYDLEELMKLF